MNNKYDNLKWKKHKNGTSHCLIEDFLFEQNHGSEYIDIYCHRFSTIYSPIEALNYFEINQVERYNEVSRRLGVNTSLPVPKEIYESGLNIFNSMEEANEFFFKKAKFLYNEKKWKFKLVNSKELNNICINKFGIVKLCLFYFSNENEFIYRIGLPDKNIKYDFDELQKAFPFMPKISKELMKWIENKYENIITERAKKQSVWEENEKKSLEKELKSLKTYLKKLKYDIPKEEKS